MANKIPEFVGIVGAIVICSMLAYGMRLLSDAVPLIPFMLIGFGGLGVLFLLAVWWEKKAADRRFRD